jgi:hypothetical protein
LLRKARWQLGNAYSNQEKAVRPTALASKAGIGFRCVRKNVHRAGYSSEIKGGDAFMIVQLQVQTRAKSELQDVTSQAQQAVTDSGVQEGI